MSPVHDRKSCEKKKSVRRGCGGVKLHPSGAERSARGSIGVETPLGGPGLSRLSATQREHQWPRSGPPLPHRAAPSDFTFHRHLRARRPAPAAARPRRKRKKARDDTRLLERFLELRPCVFKSFPTGQHKFRPRAHAVAQRESRGRGLRVQCHPNGYELRLKL